jgi:hypothetical protein
MAERRGYADLWTRDLAQCPVPLLAEFAHEGHARDLLFDVLGDEPRHHPVLGPDALAQVTAGKVGHHGFFAAAAWRINLQGS